MPSSPAAGFCRRQHLPWIPARLLSVPLSHMRSLPETACEPRTLYTQGSIHLRCTAPAAANTLRWCQPLHHCRRDKDQSSEASQWVRGIFPLPRKDWSRCPHQISWPEWTWPVLYHVCSWGCLRSLRAPFLYPPDIPAPEALPPSSWDRPNWHPPAV